MIERQFRLQEKGTTVPRELVAGLTTFASMAYILAVNPAMLSATGMDQGALITATAVASAVGCLLMALLTNYPIALAPGMGLNAFFTYGVCLGMEVPWQGALAMVFWNGVLFVLISVTGLRRQLADAIPECLKIGIQAGIGLFIALIGLQNAGIIIDDPATLLTLGPLSEGWVPNGATLALGGLVIAAVLTIRKVPGAILIAIAAVTLLGLLVPHGDGTLTAKPEGLIALPPSLAPLGLQLDWLYPFRHWETAWIVVLSLLFVDLFDSLGTLLGVSHQAKLVDEEGRLPKLSQALLADAAATSAGACLGASPVTSYVESATGVEAGGRTGLTSIFVAICFLLALFFHPLILVIPAAATAPALIFVGVLMLAGLQRIAWDDLRDVLPGVATTLLIPLSFGIANGIALGCLIYAATMLLTGQRQRVHVVLWILCVLFVLKFVFVGE